MYKSSSEILKLCSILPVFLIVPHYAHALSKYDLADGENIVLDANSTITNEIQIESSTRAAGITAAGKTSISTGDNTLTVIANSITTPGGRNYIFDTVTPGTDFTFSGNLIGTAIGTGNIEARGIRINPTQNQGGATATFNGDIKIASNAEAAAYGIDVWYGSIASFDGRVIVSAISETSSALGVKFGGGRAIDTINGANKIMFSGSLTDINAAVKTGSAANAVGIENHGNGGASVTLAADKTNITATGGAKAFGINVSNGTVYLNGDATISVSGGAGNNHALNLEGTQKYSTSVYLSGNNITLNAMDADAYAIYSSGYAYVNSSSQNLVLNSSRYGIVAQYAGAVNLDSNSKTQINVNSNDYGAGIIVTTHQKEGNGEISGKFDSSGTLNIAVNAQNATGVAVKGFQGESAHFDAKHIDVLANGNSARAMHVQSATDVNIGSNGVLSKLVAAGDDSIGLYLDDASAVRINGNTEIRGGTYDIYNDGALTLASGKTTVHNDIGGDGAITIENGASLAIGTSTLNMGTLNLNGTVYANIVSDDTYGKLWADTINVGENGLLVLNNASVGTYKIFNQYADIRIDAGFLFNAANNGVDGIVISQRTADDISADTGLSVQASAMAVAMSNSANRKFVAEYRQMMIQLHEWPGYLDTEYYNAQAARANPYDKPVLHSVATSLQNQISALTASRMSVGRAGGDVTVGYGAWVQGMHNKSKFSNNFDASTGGLAFGIDALINRKYTVGVGYANNTSDVDAHNRDIDVESHTLFAYAQYQPNKWFANATLSYTMADYDEETTLFGVPLAAEYDVDSYGAQIMTGYDFASGITPEVGIRYLHISQDDYSNGLLRFTGADSDFATAIAGMRYAFDIQSDTVLKLSPELRAAMTYDFISDDVYSTVILPGVANYRIRGDRLSRMGGEFGIGISARMAGVRVSLNYELDLHQDYTSHSGILNLKYNF